MHCVAKSTIKFSSLNFSYLLFISSSKDWLVPVLLGVTQKVWQADFPRHGTREPLCRVWYLCNILLDYIFIFGVEMECKYVYLEPISLIWCVCKLYLVLAFGWAM